MYYSKVKIEYLLFSIKWEILIFTWGIERTEDVINKLISSRKRFCVFIWDFCYHLKGINVISRGHSCRCYCLPATRRCWVGRRPDRALRAFCHLSFSLLFLNFYFLSYLIVVIYSILFWTRVSSIIIIIFSGKKKARFIFSLVREDLCMLSLLYEDQIKPWLLFIEFEFLKNEFLNTLFANCHYNSLIDTAETFLRFDQICSKVK